ncbi:MAG: hypothetical protein ABI330_21750 [Caldimonas sp.]
MPDALGPIAPAPAVLADRDDGKTLGSMATGGALVMPELPGFSVVDEFAGGFALGITLSVPPLAGPLLPALMPLAATLSIAGVLPLLVASPLFVAPALTGGNAEAAASVGAAVPGMMTLAGAGVVSSLALSQPAATIDDERIALAHRKREVEKRRGCAFMMRCSWPP